jgi:hypothetical protein
MVAITVFVGLIIWFVYDMVQTQNLTKIFHAQLTERLSKQALEDRINFDRFVKAHLHSIKLFITQKNFGEYIENKNWYEDDDIKIKNYRRSPDWFPKSSVLRTFVQPRGSCQKSTRVEVNSCLNLCLSRCSSFF